MITGPAQTAPVDSIYASGEMAERIRQFPWEKTSVGSITAWPEILGCTVNMMLESQFPTVIFWGPEMLVFYNDAYLPSMADKHPQGLGRQASECWSEAWHIIGPQCKAVMEGGSRFYFEEVLVPVLREGSLKDVYWTYSYSPIRNGGGEILGILIVCHDVTEKLALERERNTLAANLKNVLASTTDGLAVIDRQGRYSYVNDQAARIVGLDAAEMIGKSRWELFPHLAGTEFGKQYDLAVATGKPRHFDAFYPEPLNAWVECHYYPSDHGFSVYFRDITEQKRTEQALRKSESRFRRLFESDIVGIGIPDRFGAFLESNDELLRMTGYSREDQDAGLVRWDTMTPPEYAALDAAHIREAATRGSCTPYEKEYIRKDGSRVPILCGYALLEHSADEYIGFVVDLTEQKRAERELREREERFRLLADSLPQLIWVTDAAGENIYCNQRFRDYFGLDDADTWGLGWKVLVHPDDVASTVKLWMRAIESGEPYLNEYRLRRKDGEYRYFLARGIPSRDSDGRIQRWIGSSTDVHDQKLAEDALRKSEKLATAGRLAASIAHEINNPLEGITNLLYLALQDHSLTAETKGYLQTAEQELLRVAHITTQTLRFHKQLKSPTLTDICDIVDSVLGLFGQRLIGKHIQVKSECERGSVVSCFGDELRQVIANVVGNAVDAMPDGGTLRIRVRKAEQRTHEHRHGIKVVVADSGHGIPQRILDHIFEPFVSTKEATGIGLGLWVSEGIVRKHNGTIRVRSRANGQPSGTTFRIFIPSTALSE